MRVNVGPIREHKGASLDVAFEEECPELGAEGAVVESLGPLRMEARVTNTGKGMLVQGHLQAKVRLECSRCLEPFLLDLNHDFEEEFFPTRGRHSREALDAGSEPTASGGAEDGEAYHYTGDVLDISDATRENLQLSLPIKILCNSECQGLCPSCGANRNLTQCTCRSDLVDPRLAGLAKLLPELPE